MGYMVLIKILSLICNTDVINIICIAGIYTIITMAFYYLMLMNKIQGNSTMKMIISCMYPLILVGIDISIFRGYVFGFTLPLYFIILSILLNEKMNNKQSFIIVIIAWTTLGIFWHTAQIMSYLIIVSFIILYFLLNYKHEKKFVVNLQLFLVITAILIITWISLRDAALNVIFSNIDFNINLDGFFNKGSLGGEYNYIHYSPFNFVDNFRYISYIITYAVMGFILIYVMLYYYNKRKTPNNYLLITTLLIADLLFMPIYYIVSGSVEPRILLVLSIPILILIVYDSNINVMIKSIIIIALITPIILTSISNLYSYVSDNPEKNIPKEIYDNSFDWSINNINSTTLLSDTHTMGHYKLLYNEYGYYQRGYINITTVDYKIYKELVNGSYTNINNNIIIINNELYKKHLVYGSILAWTEFEPISPKSLDSNTQLKKVYDDGRIVIAV